MFGIRSLVRPVCFLLGSVLVSGVLIRFGIEVSTIAAGPQRPSARPERLASKASVPMANLKGLSLSGSSTSTNEPDARHDGPFTFLNGRLLLADQLSSALAETGIDAASMRPLSLATEDLNADGFPDLLAGHSATSGGVLIIYYGDARAFAPSEPADIADVIANRFPTPFSNASVIPLDHRPDNLFTGDFDRDSRTDILTAATGGDALHFIIADQHHGLSESRSIPVVGGVSAVAVGNKNSSDGFADVVVGTGSAELLVYEGSESLLDQIPENHYLQSDKLALARMDDDELTDIVSVSKGLVSILHGGQNSAETLSLPFAVQDLTIGDFIWDRNSQMEMAAAADDGGAWILSRGDLDMRPLSRKELRGRRQLIDDVRQGKRSASAARVTGYNPSSDWKVVEELTGGASFSGRRSPPVLTPILASGQQSVDLLSAQPGDHRLNISYRTDGLTPMAGAVARDTLAFHTDGQPAAVLPMRLNIHARPSLVVLQEGSIEPSLMFAAPEATFTVTKTTDTNDGACNADCSLREAVVAANSAVGADTVAFAAGLNGLAIQLTRVGDDNNSANGDLDINSDITVLGNGAANTLIQGSSGASFTSNMGDKVFGINQDGTFTTVNATISNLTVRFTRNDILVNAGFTQTGGATDVFLTGTGAVPGPTTNFTNVTYDSNASLHSYGGAINIDSGSLTPPTTDVHRGTVNITGSTISNNDTLTTSLADNPPSGGGISMFADRHDVTISSSTISGNATSLDIRANGGGINVRHSFGGTVTINSGTNITSNTAGSDGGGLLLDSLSRHTFSMSGGSISSNVASGTADSGTGGGVFNATNVGSASFTSVTFSSNLATAGAGGTGGGIADGANTPLTLTSCTITSNQADLGGGVAVVSSGAGQNTSIANGTAFSGNVATTGSAIYISAGIGTLSGTNSITGNIDVTSAASATLATATGSTTSLTGNLSMSNGVLNRNNGGLSITGNYSQSGGTHNGGTGTTNLTGNFTYTGGTFTAGTGTFNFNGTAAQSISNSSLIAFNNLTDSNVTLPLTINNSINVNGNLTANGANTILSPVPAAVIGGAGTLTGTGTARVTRTAATADFSSQYTITNKTLTNLLVDYVGTSAQVVSALSYGNLRLNNASGATLASGTTTVNGGLTLQSGTLAVGTNTLTLNGTVTQGTGGFSSSAAGTVNYNQSSNGQTVIAANYGNLTFSNFNKVLPTTTVGVAGTFTPGTALGHTVTNSNISFNGASAQTIPVFPYFGLTLANAAGASLGGNVTVDGSLGLAAGVLNIGTNTLTLNAAVAQTAGGLTSGVNGTVNYNQSSNGQNVVAASYFNLTFSNFNKVLPSGTITILGTFTPGTATGHTTTGNTILFSGNPAFTLPVFPYNNLTLTNTTVTLPAGTTAIGGALALNTATLAVGTNTLVINGNATNTGGSLTSSATGTVNYNQSSNGQTVLSANYGNLTFSNFNKVLPTPTIGIAGTFTPGTAIGHTVTNSNINFNGTSAQTVPVFPYFGLTLANAAGASVGGNVNVGGAFGLAAGLLNVGTNTLTLNGSVTATGGSLSAANGTVVYGQGSNGQNVLAANYGNLTFSNFNKVLPAATVGVAGVFTPGTAVGHTITGNTISFNGAGAQGVPAFTYNGLNTATGGVKTTSGAVNVNGSATVGTGTSLVVATGSTLTVTGTLTNNGTIQGIGTIVNNFTNTGTLSPGLSPGVLSFTGNYGNSGAVNIEIGGTAGAGNDPAGHDQVLISGTATMGGTLNVTLTNGFTPAAGNSFVIVDPASLSGTFATTNLPNISPNSWSVAYDNAAGSVTLTVTGPTAAGATVSGRVTDQAGRPVSRAIMTLSNPISGERRQTLTNTFGYFRFEGVAAGETYIVSVAHARYVFENSSRVVEVLDNVTDVGFVATRP